jgi:hypothetical protein
VKRNWLVSLIAILPIEAFTAVSGLPAERSEVDLTRWTPLDMATVQEGQADRRATGLAVSDTVIEALLDYTVLAVPLGVISRRLIVRRIVAGKFPLGHDHIPLRP